MGLVCIRPRRSNGLVDRCFFFFFPVLLRSASRPGYTAICFPPPPIAAAGRRVVCCTWQNPVTYLLMTMTALSTSTDRAFDSRLAQVIFPFGNRAGAFPGCTRTPAGADFFLSCGVLPTTRRPSGGRSVACRGFGRLSPPALEHATPISQGDGCSRRSAEGYLRYWVITLSGRARSPSTRDISA